MNGNWYLLYDDDGNINRQYYEMAVLTELRNSIHSGNVSIVGSREHKDLEEYLFSKKDWSHDLAKNGIEYQAISQILGKKYSGTKKLISG